MVTTEHVARCHQLPGSKQFIAEQKLDKCTLCTAQEAVATASDSRVLHAQDVGSNLQGHDKAQGEVLLRMQLINAKHSKVLVIMLWAGSISSQVVLWWETGWKLQQVCYDMLVAIAVVISRSSIVLLGPLLINARLSLTVKCT